MIRLFGAALVAVSCIFCGCGAAERLRKRKEFLKAFFNSLAVLETEICFGRHDLKSIFSRLDERNLCGFYLACAEDISEMGITSAWRKNVETVYGEGFLKSNDKTAVLSLVPGLGKSDTVGQKKIISAAAGLTERCLCEAEEEYVRLGRVYRGCGILSGAFVILMFI